MSEQSEIPQPKLEDSGDALSRKDATVSLDSSIFSGEKEVPVNWKVDVSGFVEFMKQQPKGEYMKVGPDNAVFGGAPEAAFGYVDEIDASGKKRRIGHTDTGIILKLPTLKTPKSEAYFDKRNHNYGESLAAELRSDLRMRKGMPYIISDRSRDSGATDLSFDTGQDGVALYALGESSAHVPKKASGQSFDRIATFYDNEGNDVRFFIRTNDGIVGGGDARPEVLKDRIALALEMWRVMENGRQAKEERNAGKEFPQSTLVIDKSLTVAGETLADKDVSLTHEGNVQVQIAEQDDEKNAIKLADVQDQIEKVKEEIKIPNDVSAFEQKPVQEIPKPPDSRGLSRRTVMKGIGALLGVGGGLWARKVLAPGVPHVVAQSVPPVAGTPEATEQPTQVATQQPIETQTPSPAAINTATPESTSTPPPTEEPTNTLPPQETEKSTSEPESTEVATTEPTIQPSEESPKTATSEPTEVPASPTPDIGEILKDAESITIAENGTISESIAKLNGKDMTTPEGQKWWRENYWYAVEQLGAFELANYKTLEEAFNSRRIDSEGQEVTEVNASFPEGYPSRKDILHWIEQAKSAIESMGVASDALPMPYQGKEDDLNAIDPLLKLQEALRWVAQDTKFSVPDPKYASDIIAYYSK